MPTKDIRLIKRHNTSLLRTELAGLMFRKKRSAEQDLRSHVGPGLVATAFC